MQRILWIFLLALTSPLMGKDGFYVGGGFGGYFLDGVQTGNSFGTLGVGTISNLYLNDLDADPYSKNWTGELFAGFGHHWRILYAGVEVFGQYSRSQASIRRHNDNIFPLESASEGVFTHSKVAIGPWHYGVDFRPGIFLTPDTLLYGRVGVAVTKIKFRSEVSNAGVLGVPFDTSFSDSDSKHRQFFRFGFGVEQLLTRSLALRWEYIHTDYGSLFVQGGNTGAVGASILTVGESTKVHLKTHELKLALAYYFSCCSDCYCDTCCSFNSTNFCGCYLGLGFGGAFQNSRNKVAIVTIAPGPESVEEGIHNHFFTKDLNGKEIRTVAYGGYALQYKRFFAGLEVFGQYSPAMDSGKARRIFDNGFVPALFTANTTVKGKLEIRPWQYGLQARPGFLLTPTTLLFGTIGFSFAKIQCRYDATFSNPVVGFAFSSSISERSTRAVLRAGGGVEYSLFRHWNLRADYVYSDYRSLRLNVDRSVDAGPPLGTISVTGSSNIHFIDHALTLGLVRYF